MTTINTYTLCLPCYFTQRPPRVYRDRRISERKQHGQCCHCKRHCDVYECVKEDLTK